MSDKHILIVGAGVIGLTTAWAFVNNGFRVTVIAKQFASPLAAAKLTSQVAGALWEWPPSVCGRHKDEASLARAKKWCMISYARFKELDQKFGVKMRMSNFFFKTKVEESREHLEKMLELQHRVDGFRHDYNIIEELGISKSYGIVDAYQHLAPVIDTDQFMFHLTSLLAEHPLCTLDSSYGGIVNTSLLEVENELRKAFKVNLIVNCTGLGSRELAEDNLVYPLRGALVGVDNNGTKFPVLDQCLCVSLHGREAAGDMVFIVPRNEKTLVVGGITEQNEWQVDSLDKDYEPVKNMLSSFYPPLRSTDMTDYTLSVGLRPARTKNIRLGRETRLTKDGNRSTIIHNYGHGGAGFSLSFGCAENVVAIAKNILHRTLNRGIIRCLANNNAYDI